VLFNIFAKNLSTKLITKKEGDIMLFKKAASCKACVEITIKGKTFLVGLL